MKIKATIKTGFLGTTLSFSEDVSSPSKLKEKDSLLVKVQAGAINPIDYKLPRAASGSVVGQDFCGTVAEVHPDCDAGFEVGDIVFGKAKGTLAEYTIASAKEIAKAPNGWKATDCAALTTAYWSALQSLRKGNILLEKSPAEKSVLVIGASGGCGLAGVQLCAGMGVSRIVAICSQKNDAFVRQHGATEVVNYANDSELQSFFSENQGKFDCVYDTATCSGGGADYWKMSIGLLKKDFDDKIVGEYTTLNGSPSKWIRAMSGKQKEHETLIIMDANGKDLELIVQLMEQTKAKPVTAIFSFDKEGIQKGFDLLKSRRAKGKIVFDILPASRNV